MYFFCVSTKCYGKNISEDIKLFKEFTPDFLLKINSVQKQSRSYR